MSGAADPRVERAIPVTLYLVRHGEAVGAEGRCIGHTDLPLASGARVALARLAAEWPSPRPPRIVSSDLVRAQASAAVLAEAWGMARPIPIDVRLREMDFGAWDGRLWAQLERDDAAAFGAWMADWQDARAPGGEGFGDVIVRAAGWLHEAITTARAEGVTEIVALAHAGSIRALLVEVLGLPRRRGFQLRVDHARVSALRIGGGPLAEACAGAELLFLNTARV